MITAGHTEDPFCCGVRIIGGFEEEEWFESLQELVDGVLLDYETTFITATFIDNPVCKEAYEILRSKLKLIRQTKPRKNEGSGNMVFMCIYVPRKD
jgi:hypothetical protein